MMADDARTFERRQHVTLRKAVVNPLLGFLWRYAIERADAGALRTDDPDVPGAAAAYADPVMEHLLERLRPAIEAGSGLALFPTYSYLRVYGRGQSLERHHDRASCEISVSLTLGQEPQTPWPLWIEGADGVEGVELQPGDALLYRGIDCAHWRDAYPGERIAQVFLHYVDRKGPRAEWRFDKRDGLGVTIPLPF